MAVSLEFEQAAGDVVMGIDEAGRGPLAGGVYAAAVTVPLAKAAELLTGTWAGVNDSKKLAERKREALAEVIKSTPDCTWCIASASAAEIDRLNILSATHLAMRRAALGVGEKLGEAVKMSILVDGLPVRTLPYPSRNLAGAYAAVPVPEPREGRCALALHRGGVDSREDGARCGLPPPRRPLSRLRFRQT